VLISVTCYLSAILYLYSVDGELEQQIHSTQNDEEIMITSVLVPGKNCQEDLDASEEYFHETVTQLWKTVTQLWSHIQGRQQENLAGPHVQKDFEKLHGVICEKLHSRYSGKCLLTHLHAMKTWFITGENMVSTGQNSSLQ
jgi:hypothetical protein